jgi:hypothetical protein
MIRMKRALAGGFALIAALTGMAGTAYSAPTSEACQVFTHTWTAAGQPLVVTEHRACRDRHGVTSAWIAFRTVDAAVTDIHPSGRAGQAFTATGYPAGAFAGQAATLTSRIVLRRGRMVEVTAGTCLTPGCTLPN